MINSLSSHKGEPGGTNGADGKDTMFAGLRPRLQGIAYRMLGSHEEAEDIVQEAWMRWRETAASAIDNSEAWLVSVTTRLAIDKLRAVKIQREHHVGIWLPEPLSPESSPSPEMMLEQVEDISIALLTVLERLAPDARAAFLMREVFDMDYGEIARTLGKSEAACRQLVRRAKIQIAEKRKRFAVSPEAHLRLVEDFAGALERGDFLSMKSLLVDQAEFVGDGGGNVPSFRAPLKGGERIAQLDFASSRRYGRALRTQVAPISGEWGMLRWMGGVPEPAPAFETDGVRIHRLQAQRDPEKLVRLDSRLSRGPESVPPMQAAA